MSDSPKFSLIGSSARFRTAVTHIHKFAGVGATVLIEGETGTGKEMAARAIHHLGARSAAPFVPVNCGGLAETLLESELFGHERGAFTDAKAASPGLVSQADGGTLFLDEVDSLSLKAQASLLRFLQDRTYRRVGSAQTRHANVRILVASNANLEQLVASRHFRRDLLYRLNVLVLKMPPLRERPGDALELAQSFLKRYSEEYRMPPKTLDQAFIDYLEANDWPGNVRELENVVHREFLMCEGAKLHGPLAATSGPETAYIDARSFKEAKARSVADFEKRYVEQLMQQSEGNITHAARLAGQDRSAFGKLVRKHHFNAYPAAEADDQISITG